MKVAINELSFQLYVSSGIHPINMYIIAPLPYCSIFDRYLRGCVISGATYHGTEIKGHIHGG